MILFVGPNMVDFQRRSMAKHGGDMLQTFFSGRPYNTIDVIDHIHLTYSIVSNM